METLIAMLIILGLAFIQNISFSIVSRSRNRNNMRYHLIAAFFSNTIWFITFRQLVKADMTFVFFLPYCAGTMCGSLCGVRISMFIEKLLGAEADGHLSKDSGTMAEDLTAYFGYPTTKNLVAYFDYIAAPRLMGLKGIGHLGFGEWLEAGKPESQEDAIKPMSDELRYARYEDSRLEPGLKHLTFAEWIKAGKPNMENKK